MSPKDDVLPNRKLDPSEYLNKSQYKRIYMDLQRYLTENQVDVPRMGEKAQIVISRFDSEVRGFILKELSLAQSTNSLPLEIQERIDTVVNDMTALVRGYGPLQPYMEGAIKLSASGGTAIIEEIIVRNGCILLEMGGKIQVAIDTTQDFLKQQEIDSQFEILAKRIADDQKQPVSSNKPFSVVTIPDTGDRMGVIIPPLAKNFVALNVRVFPRGNPYTFTDLQEKGAFANVHEAEKMKLKRKIKEQYDKFLSDLILSKANLPADTPDGKVDEPITEENVSTSLYKLGREARMNYFLDTITDDDARHDFEEIKKRFGNQVALFLAYYAYLNLGTALIAGEFSSGKTSLLNAMSYFIRKDVSPVVIEDYVELKMTHPYILRLETSKIFDQGVVLNTVLTRMRPDLIIVGELVEKMQAFEFLNASNLGKKSWSTIHSNDAYAALIRLENLATVEGYTPYEIRRRIVNSIDMVVHVSQEAGHRFVNEIALVGKKLDSGNDYSLNQIYKSGRRGLRHQLIGSLWDGIKEQD